MCGSGFLDLDLFSVDGGYGSLPACESFFEIEVNGLVDVVAFAGVERVFFLVKLVYGLECMVGCDELPLRR